MICGGPKLGRHAVLLVWVLQQQRRELVARNLLGAALKLVSASLPAHSALRAAATSSWSQNVRANLPSKVLLCRSARVPALLCTSCLRSFCLCSPHGVATAVSKELHLLSPGQLHARQDAWRRCDK